jgi:branched-chain amino acid transport system ATP-binding protein
MIDELSLGLAPILVEELVGAVRRMRDAGTTIILVEQSVNVALTVANRAYFMEKGEVRFEGPTRELLEHPEILRSVFIEGVVEASSTGNGSVTTDAPRVAETSGRGEVVLEVDAVSRSFGGIQAVSEVSLTLHEGEILGIIGPNGAGKTTLFDLISGFTAAESGSVRIEGFDVSSFGPDVRARAGLGRSFQDARLFPGLTVTETIALSLERYVEVKDPLAAALNMPGITYSERAIAARVDELVALLGLEAYRDKFIAELSTGTRRIVDLACVLASRPRVLMFDEPSSGIAQREAEALGPLIRQIHEQTGASILVIEHDMPLISSVSDELVAMDLGKVVLRGDPHTVLHDPRVIETYLGSQKDLVNRSDATVPTRRREPLKAAGRR